ncbi:hypothetical protein COT94_03855 [Candidatus Falkowbacteria bacterium CG10_big_fil_rev_8_21_14_0_10_37_14]|uniref:Transmembrane protein n=1 Tax=Candidatus Falkowbacteria bacterium CG10_big_fil_rev_8_21_14_0_10_37_14 TaxID=1974561 RepID=A0A2M6WSM4_9BACT|nr:hypothetical protein [Candidatus Falkowbacteria bacterium]PIT95696.1 MAG: hypothetical protein COT94_03855 [Candidatus Falkowbacteria bacterium CG10_big_fil_rev_8_21_14_0_10_37_14]
MGLQNTINDIQRQRQRVIAYTSSQAEKELNLETLSRLKIYSFLAFLIIIVIGVASWDYINITAPARCYKQCEQHNLIGYESINCFQKCEK